MKGIIEPGKSSPKGTKRSDLSHLIGRSSQNFPQEYHSCIARSVHGPCTFPFGSTYCNPIVGHDSLVVAVTDGAVVAAGGAPGRTRRADAVAAVVGAGVAVAALVAATKSACV